MMRIVLILGSAPIAVEARAWPRGPLTDIVAVNNAWRIRDDWDYWVYPDDLEPDRFPTEMTGTAIGSDGFVEMQNRYGGFVYAGGTMAFTAGYWALGALKPDVMAYFGCDMVYSATGNTHFYGQGPADPLRKDVTLRSLEAKGARLMLHAAKQGCACVNLSTAESRLIFPRARLEDLAGVKLPPSDPKTMEPALSKEAELGYQVSSGRYWLEEDRFDASEIDKLDALWLDALKAHEAA